MDTGCSSGWGFENLRSLVWQTGDAVTKPEIKGEVSY